MRTTTTSFQPTLPARGATAVCGASCFALSNFNPRSPHGERRREVGSPRRVADFNPRSPHGERQDTFALPSASDISTHAPRTGSDAVPCHVRLAAILISTHAPRTGSDTKVRQGANPAAYFNPRSPHGERRHPQKPSKRSANFNPRSPHGERRETQSGIRRSKSFQPTLPARGATVPPHVPLPHSKISTHAPRTGSDSVRGVQNKTPDNFNPRSPHGERLSSCV